MNQEISDEEKAKRVGKFSRIIGYRRIMGWVVVAVGLGLLGVGLRDSQVMLTVNGILFLGYGLFMTWQASKALSKLN